MSWLNGSNTNVPTMSHTLLKNKFFNNFDNNGCTFLLVIDNLRYDQWKMIQPIVQDYFKVENEELFFSILPSATQYARNAIFSGLLPSEMEKRHPDWWKNDEDEGGKNMHEEDFLNAQLKRLGKDVKTSYNKITNFAAGKSYPKT